MKKVLLLSMVMVSLHVQSMISTPESIHALFLKRHAAQTDRQRQVATVTGIGGVLASLSYFLQKATPTSSMLGNMRRLCAIPFCGALGMQAGIEITRIFEIAEKGRIKEQEEKAQRLKEEAEKAKVCTGKPTCKMGCQSKKDA